MNKPKLDNPEKQTDWADYMLAGCFMSIVLVCVYVCVCAYM